MDCRQPDDDRRARLRDRVRAVAEDEGVPVGVRHVGLAAAAVLGASGVVVHQVCGRDRSEPVSVTGPPADRVGEAEITFGEGPAVDCLREGHPVVATDLAAACCTARWPVFAPFARSSGVAGVLAFPVMMGAAVVGCLEALRPTATPCTDAELADGVLLADAAMLLLLRAEPPRGDAFADAVRARWALVRQATGVVSGQTDSDLATAFVRLRAHAYWTGRRLGDVAADVVARGLRFQPEVDAQPDAEPE